MTPTEIEQIKRPVLLPIAITMALLFIAVVLCVVGLHRLFFSHQMRTDITNVQRVFANMLDERQLFIGSLLDEYSRDDRLIQAYRSRDREKLLAVTQPIFNKIRDKYQITHFYFIDSDRNCFLRVHNPPRRGDTINRFTMMRAVRTNGPAAGIELGPFGTFTLRVVQPWRVDGNLLGYIELGTEIEYITPAIKNCLGVEILVAIDKSYLTEKGWQEGLRMTNRTGNWQLFPHHAIVDQTTTDIPAILFEQLQKARQEPRHDDYFTATSNDRTFNGGISALTDTGGRHVGEFIVLRDCSAQAQSLQTVLWLLFAVAGSLGGLLLFFFAIHLNRLEKNLLAKHDQLRQEIAERSQTEKSLQESNESLRALIHASPLAIMTVDSTGAIQSWNLSAEQIFHWPEEKVIGRQPPFIIGADEDVFNQCLHSTFLGETVKAADISGLRKNGDPVDLILSTAPLRDQNGKIGKALLIFQDTTSRKRTEAHLREAQKMKAIGTLAGGIAHDFNNILTTILGYAGVALRLIDQGNPAHAHLREIITAGKRAASLVSQLLTFSRKKEQERHPVLLQDVISEVLSFLRGTIPTTIQITQKIDPSCGPIMADATQMHQVVMNLCINGYQAMREKGGVLALTLEKVQIDADTAASRNLPAGTCARLIIQDDGVGMDEDTMSRIFEPYFSTKELGQGTGLGLSMVHGIIHGLKGSISVSSAPGHGSRFTIHIPVISQPVLPERHKQPEAVPPRLQNKVIFVDDEKSITQICQYTLQEIGCEVRAFTDSREALATFKQDPDWCDILITDQVMPHLTGIDLAKEMLTMRPALPIIMITGYSDTVDEKRAKAAGIKAFIMKPVTQEALITIITKTLSQPQPTPSLS
ncbi:MAG: response regulator [Desulfobulbaceae bacterium]|nr:response regulator [Desulfobulbaceae bacterium]